MLNLKSGRAPSKSSEPRRGVAMVETALVLPIMMMVILGVVEFGRAFMVCQLLTNSAREGGRLAVLQGTSTADVVTEVQTLVNKTVGVDTADVQVEVTVTPYGTTTEHTDLSIAKKRDLCDIRVTVGYDQVSFVPIKWLTGVNLVGQAAMRHE